MTKEQKKDKLIQFLCKEYQAVVLIDLVNMTRDFFTADEEHSILESGKFAAQMESYEKTRLWYIDNYVVEEDRRMLLEKTSVETVLDETKNGKLYYVEYSRIKDGKVNYNQLCFDSVVDDDGNTRYVILGFRNIDSERKAEIDDLTGLLTRHAFLEKAEKMMAGNPDKNFNIIISDIVDFKKINETYGIKTADKILKWNGNYLSKVMSDKVLVGRYSGDQMVIFAAEDDYDEATKKIGGEEYLEAMKSNGLPDVVIKFGLYKNIRHDASILSSCDKAHLALNSIKNHYDITGASYDDRFIEALDKKRRIEDSMYPSLKNGDFKVYYQPKHEARTGKLVGAEALIRWIHPEYGFMSPADFIPLFEKNGFIVENDKYVWERTCENLRKWNDMGINTVPISVNVSKLTMSKVDIVADMKTPVDRNGISPKDLHVEITETLMTDNSSELVKKLNDMRSIGFEVELDDFGSGYSSINVLSMLPLDVVKLDMSFMQQFGDEKKSKVLAACINLAKELGFRTVSEGVEYKEQTEVLGELGIDMIQGYYYSKPLPEDEFEKYMEKYQKED